MGGCLQYGEADLLGIEGDRFDARVILVKCSLLHRGLLSIAAGREREYQSGQVCG